jgi:PTH1 family peptidyl-tRNA hydrolase
MDIELVVGLGNPGENYASTRHNVGFQVLQELLRRHNGVDWLERASCELSVIRPARLVALARPQTYMNRSGEAAGWLLEEFELSPEQMLVVVDDIDLPLAQLRIRPSGGPGTHNGLRDLCREIGTGFPRLRVGVQGEELSGDLADYVTSPFSPDEVDLAKSAVSRAADAVQVALQNGVEAAMNAYNRSPSATQF